MVTNGFIFCVGIIHSVYVIQIYLYFNTQIFVCLLYIVADMCVPYSGKVDNSLILYTKFTHEYMCGYMFIFFWYLAPFYLHLLLIIHDEKKVSYCHLLTFYLNQKEIFCIN